MHQQQIRNAVGKEGLLKEPLFRPFLDTFMQGLPYTFRSVDAPIGTCITILVNIGTAWQWHLQKNVNSWALAAESVNKPEAIVRIDPEAVWRLFSKGISPEDSLDYVQLSGNKDLGMHVLRLVAVME